MSAGLRAGTSNDGYLQINGTDVLTALSSGRVGIGTSNPLTRLHVYTSGEAKLRIESSDSANAYAEINAVPGAIYYDGRNTTSAPSIIFRRIGSAGTFESLRINSDGNVGIGTNSVSAKLDVVGSAGIRVNEDGASTKVITIRSDWAGVDPAINVTTNHSLLLMTNNTEKVRILSGGNVGIGTSNPNAKLTVSGDILVGKTVSYAGDFISAGGGNTSAYNGLALISNAQSIIAQSNNTLPSWIVDIGGRAADGVTFNPNTADAFSIRRTAAAGTFYGASELFKINNTGIITAPGQICFHAYRIGDGTQYALGTYIYDQTLFNRGNCYGTSTGNFTAPVTGAYYFIASVQFYGISGPGTTSMYFNKNGVQAIPGNSQFVDDGAGGAAHETHYAFSILQLNANDYVNVYRTTTTRNMQSNFCGFLIG